MSSSLEVLGREFFFPLGPPCTFAHASRYMFGDQSTVQMAQIKGFWQFSNAKKLQVPVGLSTSPGDPPPPGEESQKKPVGHAELTPPPRGRAHLPQYGMARTPPPRVTNLKKAVTVAKVASVT